MNVDRIHMHTTHLKEDNKVPCRAKKKKRVAVQEGKQKSQLKITKSHLEKTPIGAPKALEPKHPCGGLLG